jgi:hypothetical protein
MTTDPAAAIAGLFAAGLVRHVRDDGHVCALCRRNRIDSTGEPWKEPATVLVLAKFTFDDCAWHQPYLCEEHLRVVAAELLPCELTPQPSTVERAS